MRPLCYTLIGAALLFSCADEAQPPSTTAPSTADSLIARGAYLTTVGGCQDCHSGKKMTPEGPVIDSARQFAGHTAGEVLPPLDAASLQPGGWMAMNGATTAFAGPWGVSYVANLTPDSATGIGTWTEDMFIRALRTGRHMGVETGRPILPPMPWYNLARLKDEDLRAIWAYFRSLPPVFNRVPAPTPPDAVVVK